MPLLVIALALPSVLLVWLTALFVQMHRNAGSGLARWLGLVALVPLVWVSAGLAYDLSRDSTSRNLWPLEIFFAGLVGLVVLAVQWLVAPPRLKSGEPVTGHDQDEPSP